MKTAEQFKNAKVLQERVTIHNCTFCDYECGFIFTEGKVFYDSGCYCVNYRNVRQRDWEYVASLYNSCNEKLQQEIDKCFEYAS